MADSSVAITQGSGTAIDARTESTNGNYRQVVVLGDPATNDGVAPVDATAGLKVNLGADNDVTVTGTVTANGGVAHDSEDSGNPVKIGSKAITALSDATLVASADRADAQSDLDGAIIFRKNGTLGDIISGMATITDGSSTSVISAAGSGIKVYITDVIISNSTASTFVTVDLRDGTGGSVKATLPVPASGGVVHRFDTPLAFSANTAVAADPSASATSIVVTLLGFKSKI